MNNCDSPRLLVVHLDVAELEAVARPAFRDELAGATKQSCGAGSPSGHDGELEPLLTASQLTSVLNCSVRTLKTWLQEGAAPPPLETPGSQLRWYKPAAKHWLEHHCLRAAESTLLRSKRACFAGSLVANPRNLAPCLGAPLPGSLSVQVVPHELGAKTP